jgi:hypothetical protein
MTLAIIVLATGIAAADEYEKEPIRYRTAPDNNPVSRLRDRLAAGQATLTFDKGTGYLRSLVRELNVPVSSQTLVFSKTSLQRERIAPATPRAIYFNDEVYVGFCQHGDVAELTAMDPQLGAVFYTLAQDGDIKPRIIRQGDACLSCHGASPTHGVPGNLVRSVFVDAGGFPLLSSGSYRIDQTSPLHHRWGGWYVTGTHGQQSHLGNFIARGKYVEEPVKNPEGQNVTKLDKRFDTSCYLSGHSDLVALMVLEHQAEAQNLITKAAFETRIAVHQELALNRELNEKTGTRWPSTTSRIRSVCEPLVRYLLFADEAKLAGEVRGTTTFAQEFQARGPFDAKGRSLRTFDLDRRLFKYPCSYLVYSPQFDALPPDAKTYVWRRLGEILSGRDTSETFAHLSAADRRAIREILRETKRELPADWASP